MWLCFYLNAVVTVASWYSKPHEFLSMLIGKISTIYAVQIFYGWKFTMTVKDKTITIDKYSSSVFSFFCSYSVTGMHLFSKDWFQCIVLFHFQSISFAKMPKSRLSCWQILDLRNKKICYIHRINSSIWPYSVVFTMFVSGLRAAGLANTNLIFSLESESNLWRFKDIVKIFDGLFFDRNLCCYYCQIYVHYLLDSSFVFPIKYL